MIEVEIKVPIDDKSTIVEKLKKIGFNYKKVVRQEDVYFQHPERNFVKTDEALRVRESLEGTFLNYKGPKLDSETKTREEIEIYFEDNGNLIRIFEKLGFQKVFIVKKSREIFEKNEIKASIDNVEGLGLFMELEIICEDRKELDIYREKLFSILRQINISKNKIIRKSYLELLLKI
ncbi:MAG: class IV adenylate cyclase [Candidatus Helarchaeota archaeon]